MAAQSSSGGLDADETRSPYRSPRRSKQSPREGGSPSQGKVPSGFAPGRKSRKASNWGELSDMALVAKQADEENSNYAYMEVLAEAKMCVGHGSDVGSFPEEWDAQLLVDCGRTSEGHRLVIFTPAFLKPMIHDEHELDRAFKYLFLNMDGFAMREKFVFVYCYQGIDWSNSSLNHRLRMAYDIIPRRYSKNLRKFYVLHPTGGFRVLMWTFWPWLTSRLWAKIEYVYEIDTLCAELQPEDLEARVELRRRFPQMVQREGARLQGELPPATFGVPLKSLCDSFGVDFTDKTTGRWYPRLPPALVFLCEALERQAADDSFAAMFTADATTTYDLVASIDEGEPLDPETPPTALWCALKLFLDCMPAPLLSFQTFNELILRQIAIDDREGQRAFLAEVIRHNLALDAAYMTLYLASFLHTMVEHAETRSSICASPHQDADGKDRRDSLGSTGSADSAGSEGSEDGGEHGRAHDKPPAEEPQALTFELAAEVFAAGFLRPRMMTEAHMGAMPTAVALVETLLRCAEEKDLSVGKMAKPVLAPPPKYNDEDSE